MENLDCPPENPDPQMQTSPCGAPIPNNWMPSFAPTVVLSDNASISST